MVGACNRTSVDGERLRNERKCAMTAEDGSSTPTTTQAGAIVEFLEGEGVSYELIEHDPTMSGADEARTMHLPPDQVTKTIVLHDGSAYMFAAIPASRQA